MLPQCGFNGDNWDMSIVSIKDMFESTVYVYQEGTIPRDGIKIVKRFTSDDNTMEFIVR
jgi:hypothetical protein